MTDREPFDENDPQQRVADGYRFGMNSLALAMMQMPDYQRLNATENLEALIVGSLVGLFCNVFASMDGRQDGHDAITKYILEYIPVAAETAREIKDGAESKVATKQ